jgi:hypothetical protein
MGKRTKSVAFCAGVSEWTVNAIVARLRWADVD